MFKHQLKDTHRTLPLSTLLARAGPIDTITMKNKGGCINLEGSSSSAWGFGSWSRVLLTAGAVYWYRNELRIIGRGVLAGAKLAIERCEANAGRAVEKKARSKSTAQEKEASLIQFREPGPTAPPRHKSSIEPISNLQRAAAAFHAAEKAQEEGPADLFEGFMPLEGESSMYPGEISGSLEHTSGTPCGGQG